MHHRPALKVLLLFIAGILTGKFFDLPLLMLFGFCVLFFFGAFTLWYADKGKNLPKEICLGAGLLIAGTILFELRSGYFPMNHISNFANNREAVAVRGVVVRYPERRVNKTNFTVDVKEIFVAPKVLPVTGRILVGVPGESGSFQYGDEIIVRGGTLRKPRDRRNPGEFDYRAYLAAQGIFGIISNPSYVQKVSSGHGSWVLRKIIFPVKKYLDDYINGSLPAEEGALLRGLMIGERGEIPLELRDAFSKLGVVHILAVSGLHVGFIILIFIGVLGFLRVPRTARVFLTLLGLIFYAYLTNLKPPVVRASIMGGLLLIGTLLERKTDSFNILSIAAFFLLILNPLELFQSGFQLSFAAVSSIVYLYPKIKSLFPSATQKFQKNLASRYALELFFVSLAAFLGTLPFTIIYFHRIPNFSILANLLVIPLAFCGLANGLLAAVFNLFWPALANLYQDTTWLSLHVLIKLVDLTGQIPFNHWEFYKFSLVHIAAYFTGLLLLVNLKKYNRAKRWAVIYLLILINIFIWRGAHRSQPELRVTFIDVGQGDAALLTFPDGRHALIDAGPRGFRYDAGKWVIAPYLKREGIREIQALILSHADSDHIGGAPHIMRNFKVHEVWDNGKEKDAQLVQEYVGLIDSLHIERRILQSGTWLTDFDPVQIFIVHPSNNFLEKNDVSTNDGSLSLKIAYRDVDFLFMGDVGHDGEALISKFGELLQSEVMKVSHHGSKSSSAQFLLDQVRPELAVISVGEMNKFGHPDEDVLKRLASLNAKILRTDWDAAILLKTDGREVQRVHWR